MKCTVLVENTGQGIVKNEHGLSLLISYGDKQILLDGGSSNLFIENAKKLHVSLEKVDAAVLSHGHYDHSGGFSSFLQLNQKAPLYMQKKAREECYAKGKNGPRYLGVPKDLFQYEDRIIYVPSSLTSIFENVYLLGHSTVGLKEKGKFAGLYRMHNGQLIPDDFSHEQSLILVAKKGLVVFNSCSHSGIDVVVEEALKAFPGQKVYAVVGGFHLMTLKGVTTCAYSKEEVITLFRRLQQLGVSQIYTGHCTGNIALDWMVEEGKNMVHPLSSGQVFSIES